MDQPRNGRKPGSLPFFEWELAALINLQLEAEAEWRAARVGRAVLLFLHGGAS
jgi:hypothetical protein